jgi:glycine cleavage system H protein
VQGCTHTILQAAQKIAVAERGELGIQIKRVKCGMSAGPREWSMRAQQRSVIAPLNKKMAYPKDYKYTKEHEWIQVKGNSATVGITDHAQESLGDIVFVELPKVGAQVEAGKSFGTVESVKAVSELYAPASGKVVEVNESLNQGPEAVNQDAHAAWMIKLELTNPSQADGLMSADDYEKYVAEEK